MIKKYLEFITESQMNGFNSIGEWVESLIDDDYIKNIVIRYTKEIDPSIDLSNAINILDERTKSEIKYQVEEYLKHGIEEKDPDILASVDTEELNESDISTSGKGVFTSFLKSLTALGRKESNPNWDKCPLNYILYYYYDNIDSESTKQVFSRFKSLSRYLELIDYSKNELNIYFGVKCDGVFEYGFNYDGNHIIIGQFKLSASVIKWICNIDSKSAQSLKKELVNLTYSDILTLGKIKMDMAEFTPGYHESRMNPTLVDKVMTFAYQGAGNWNMGKLNDGDYLDIKNKFNMWVLSRKWGNKVLVHVRPVSFWVYVYIKLK